MLPRRKVRPWGDRAARSQQLLWRNQARRDIGDFQQPTLGKPCGQEGADTLKCGASKATLGVWKKGREVASLLAQTGRIHHEAGGRTRLPAQDDKAHGRAAIAPNAGRQHRRGRDMPLQGKPREYLRIDGLMSLKLRCRYKVYRYAAWGRMEETVLEPGERRAHARGHTDGPTRVIAAWGLLRPGNEGVADLAKHDVGPFRRKGVF